MSSDLERAAIALYDRFTHEGLDRRTFMAEMTRIAGGSAAAALLVSSIAARAGEPQVAATDARIRARDIEWTLAPGRTYKGYAAAPVGAAADSPVVMVIHENRGLNEHIRDVARRFAVAGFVAIAVDFLSVAGGTPADEDQARTMIGQLDMPQTVADGVATIRWMASQGGASRRVGIVGFCWGGAMVHRLSVAAGESLSAAVSFYGPAPDPSEASRVDAPVLIHLAGRDQRVNTTGIPWAEALRTAGKDVTLVNHPDVDHAFHNDTSAARYNREAAERAWAATVQFFGRHLRRD